MPPDYSASTESLTTGLGRHLQFFKCHQSDPKVNKSHSSGVKMSLGFLPPVTLAGIKVTLMTFFTASMQFNQIDS